MILSPSFVLFCLLSLICDSQFQPTPLKSVILTPSNTSQQGATINIPSSSELSTSTATQWNIIATEDDTWHLVLDMDNTWGFHPTKPSTITVTISSPTQPGSSTFDDIIIGFTVPNTNEYIASRLFMDNAGSNRITPGCDYTAPYSSVSLKSGDLQNILSGTDYRFCPLDLQQTGCNNGPNQYMRNSQGSSSITNTFPIQFTLENHPNDYILLSYQDTQKCGFNQGFETNKGFQVYFAIRDDGMDCAVTSFQIEYSYDLTYDPTTDPTTDPTVDPTIVPTKYPTKYPTIDPTTDPSKYPSINPTEQPSETPTTLSPSISPSVSKIMTKTPSLSVIQGISTKSPTYNDANVDNDITTTSLRYNQNEDENKEESEGIHTNYMIYIIIGVIVCYILFCIIFALRIRNRIKEAKKLGNKHLNYIHAANASTIGIDQIEDKNGNIAMIQIDHNKRISANNNNNDDFEANLTNLSGVNNIIMDDVIDDMNINDDDINVVTKGKHIGSNADDTTNTNEEEQGDSTEDTGEIDVEFDNDEDIINGYDTLGVCDNNQQKNKELQSIHVNNNNDDEIDDIHNQYEGGHEHEAMDDVDIINDVFNEIQTAK